MTSQLRVLRTLNDVSLIEERIYVLIPYLTIETTYFVTSGRIPEGSYFNSIDVANRQFEAEVQKSEGKPLLDLPVHH